MAATDAERQFGVWTILKGAASDWFRHRSARLGAALAYYSVFSLGPLLLIVAAIAGLFWGAEAARGSIVAQFRSLLGESGSRAIEAMLQGASSSSPAAGRPRWESCFSSWLPSALLFN
jgi:membrane protein